jgi:hypothetical protein
MYPGGGSGDLIYCTDGPGVDTIVIETSQVSADINLFNTTEDVIYFLNARSMSEIKITQGSGQSIITVVNQQTTLNMK